MSLHAFPKASHTTLNSTHLLLNQCTWHLNKLMGLLSWPNLNSSPQILKNKFTADKLPLRMANSGFGEICETPMPCNSAMLAATCLSVVEQQDITITRKSWSYQVSWWTWTDFFLFSMGWGENWSSHLPSTWPESRGISESAHLKQMRTTSQPVSFIHIFNGKTWFCQLFTRQISNWIFFLLLNLILVYFKIRATVSKLWNTRVKQ